MKKKLLSVILTLAMMVSFVTVIPVNSAEIKTGEKLSEIMSQVDFEENYTITYGEYDVEKGVALTTESGSWKAAKFWGKKIMPEEYSLTVDCYGSSSYPDAIYLNYTDASNCYIYNPNSGSFKSVIGGIKTDLTITSGAYADVKCWQFTIQRAVDANGNAQFTIKNITTGNKLIVTDSAVTKPTGGVAGIYLSTLYSEGYVKKLDWEYVALPIIGQDAVEFSATSSDNTGAALVTADSVNFSSTATQNVKYNTLLAGDYEIKWGRVACTSSHEAYVRFNEYDGKYYELRICNADNVVELYKYDGTTKTLVQNLNPNDETGVVDYYDNYITIKQTENEGQLTFDISIGANFTTARKTWQVTETVPVSTGGYTTAWRDYQAIYVDSFSAKHYDAVEAPKEPTTFSATSSDNTGAKFVADYPNDFTITRADKLWISDPSSITSSSTIQGIRYNVPVTGDYTAKWGRVACTSSHEAYVRFNEYDGKYYELRICNADNVVELYKYDGTIKTLVQNLNPNDETGVVDYYDNYITIKQTVNNGQLTFDISIGNSFATARKTYTVTETAPISTGGYTSVWRDYQAIYVDSFNIEYFDEVETPRVPTTFTAEIADTFSGAKLAESYPNDFIAVSLDTYDTDIESVKWNVPIKGDYTIKWGRITSASQETYIRFNEYEGKYYQLKLLANDTLELYKYDGTVETPVLVQDLNTNETELPYYKYITIKQTEDNGQLTFEIALGDSYTNATVTAQVTDTTPVSIGGYTSVWREFMEPGVESFYAEYYDTIKPAAEVSNLEYSVSGEDITYTFDFLSNKDTSVEDVLVIVAAYKEDGKVLINVVSNTYDAMTTAEQKSGTITNAKDATVVKAFVWSGWAELTPYHNAVIGEKIN